MSSYKKNKTAIFKWREENIDYWRQYQRLYAKEHYDSDKKKEYYQLNKEKKKLQYLKKKELNLELKEFMNILLD